MQVANNRKDSVEDMFYYVTFCLLQVENGCFFLKIPYLGWMHMHKHDTFVFNIKKTLKQLI